MASLLQWRRWYFSVPFLACTYLSFSYILGNIEKNGFATELYSSFVRDGVPLLPGCLEPAVTHYTGVSAVDQVLVEMMRFFWSCVSGDYAPLSIFAIWMVGQVLALNTVMAVEGVRAGNSGTLIAYPYLWQQIYQLMTWGFTMSNYWHFHFFWSPISRASQSGTGIPPLKLLLPKIPTDVLVIPLSLTIGCIVPTVLPALPLFTPAEKQYFLALWQIFPTCTAIAQFFLARIARQYYPKHETVPVSLTRAWLRFAYAYGLILTSLVHLAVIFIVAFPHAQEEFLPESARGLVTFRNVFGTSYGLGHPPPVTSFEQGTLDLLLMDTYWASAASLLWLVIVDGGLSVDSGMPLVLGFLVAGPTGAVLAWTWWRDEMAFEIAEEIEKAGKKE